jgi:hypothetical protein
MVRIIASPDGQRLAHGPVRDLAELDPDTGRPRRTIARSTDPERYGIRVSEFVA